MKAKMCLISFRKIKHIDVYHGITVTLKITFKLHISTKILLLSSRNRVYGEVDSIKKQSKQKLEQNLSCFNTRSTSKIYRVLWFL